MPVSRIDICVYVYIYCSIPTYKMCAYIHIYIYAHIYIYIYICIRVPHVRVFKASKLRQQKLPESTPGVRFQEVLARQSHVTPNPELRPISAYSQQLLGLRVSNTPPPNIRPKQARNNPKLNLFGPCGAEGVLVGLGGWG